MWLTIMWAYDIACRSLYNEMETLARSHMLHMVFEEVRELHVSSRTTMLENSETACRYLNLHKQGNDFGRQVSTQIVPARTTPPYEAFGNDHHETTERSVPSHDLHPMVSVQVTNRIGILFTCAYESHAILITCLRNRVALVRSAISLGDIHNLPTLWVLALFGNFYNFCSDVQTCPHLGGGGGMCILFEICEKRPFQKCMGWGGIGNHIFEYRGRTFRCFRVFGPQATPLSVRDTNSQVFPWVLRHIVELEQSERR